MEVWDLYILINKNEGMNFEIIVIIFKSDFYLIFVFTETKVRVQSRKTSVFFQVRPPRTCDINHSQPAS